MKTTIGAKGSGLNERKRKWRRKLDVEGSGLEEWKRKWKQMYFWGIM